MKKYLALLPFLVCGPVIAEQPSDFDGTMKDVAADLSALHRELQAIYETEISSRHPYSQWRCRAFSKH